MTYWDEKSSPQWYRFLFGLVQWDEWSLGGLTVCCSIFLKHKYINHELSADNKPHTYRKIYFSYKCYLNFSINQNSLKPITLWRYTVFNKKENVKINPNNSKFISICQMVWFSDIRLYKMWRAGKFLAEWLHWSVVRGNTKSKQVLMTYILICTIQFFTTFWKKKNSMEVWIIACNTYN